MKSNYIIAMIAMAIGFVSQAQVKVGDNPTVINPDAVLEIESTDQGLLLPRIALTATTNAAPLAANVAGMTVYNTATAGDVTPGYYYNDGTQWVRLADAAVLAMADATEDAWVDNGTRVELGTLADGTTARPAGTEFVALDNGNVGIGNTNPAARLTVTSTGVTDETAGIRLENGTANSVIYMNADSDLVIQKASENNQLVLDNSGRIGVNTDAPTARLDVDGNARVRDLTGADAPTDVIVTADATTGELKEGGTLASALAAAGVDGSDDAWVNTGTRVQLGTLADGTTARPAGTEFVALDNGNVGIGTAAPTETLDVNGNILVNSDGTSGNRIRLRRRASDGSSGGFSSIGTYQIDAIQQGLVLSGNGNAGAGADDHVFIQQNTGNVGIGVSDPSVKFDVDGRARVRTIPAGVAADDIVTTDANGDLRRRTVTQLFANGANAGDNHLGDFNQTLSAARSINFNGNDLTLDVANDGTTQLRVGDDRLTFGRNAGDTDDGLITSKADMRFIADNNNNGGGTEGFAWATNASQDAGTGDANYNELMTLIEGPTTNDAQLDLNGSANFSREINTGGAVELNSLGTGDRNGILDFHSEDGVDRSFRIRRFPSANGIVQIQNNGDGRIEFLTNFGTTQMVISSDANNGNVGIGNGVVPSEKLDVGGNIRASGNIFATGTVNGSNFPDYVFEKYFEGSSDLDPSYKMLSLEEIEAFTKANKHLPGVQTAAQVKENGMIVNELARTNLEKVEELFLHTIEQEKKIKKLKQQNAELLERLAKIEKTLSISRN